tara:strand:- start:11906 stop:12970 length:1065 start_codon:yes stop_codon:yes gene_type:complete
MDKINSRSPFYLEVDGGEPTPTPQTIPILCGGTHNVATDVGVVTYQVETPEVGTFRVDITGSDVPAKFTLKWNGSESTTNYIGLDTYDQDLLDAGVLIGEIATGITSTKADNFVQITKSAAQPELVELVVNAPLINDAYEVDFNCPTTPPIIINQTTQMNIWFDSSGSMNTTLAPLQSMVANNLKSCLVQFYNDDPLEYDKYVQVRSWSDERTFSVAASEPDVVGATNCINFIFQDEAQSIYFSNTSTFNAGAITSTMNTDLLNLRSVLTTNASDYVTPVVFDVQGFSAFKQMLQAVENGTGVYGGGKYLDDLTGQYKFVYDVRAGVSYASEPDYYRDLIIQAINDLGFSITCP